MGAFYYTPPLTPRRPPRVWYRGAMLRAWTCSPKRPKEDSSSRNDRCTVSGYGGGDDTPWPCFLTEREALSYVDAPVGVVCDLGDGGDVHRAVELSVAAGVEPTAVLQCTGRLDGSGAVVTA